jgi:hypothetical protein
MPFAADLALEEAAESLEYPMHRVDLARVTTKEAFLEAVGKALGFPDWYGHNWDALADCLTDLSWMAADGYVIVLERADAFASAAHRLRHRPVDLPGRRRHLARGRRTVLDPRRHRLRRPRLAAGLA